MGIHRLFVAVELPAAVRATVDDVRRQWRRRLGAASEAVRWVPRQQLHLTLHFLGDVDDDDSDTVRSVVSGGWPLTRFEVALGAPGVFPPRGRPRVLWLGLARGDSALRALFAATATRLEAVGQPVERGRFRPHLTVGRVRCPGEVTSGAVLDAWPRSVREPAWTVDRVVLFESRLSSSGVTHHALSHAGLVEAATLASTSGGGES